MFGMPSTVYAGSRAIGDDYTSESGASRFESDTVLHGPALGLTMRL